MVCLIQVKHLHVSRVIVCIYLGYDGGGIRRLVVDITRTRSQACFRSDVVMETHLAARVSPVVSEVRIQGNGSVHNVGVCGSLQLPRVVMETWQCTPVKIC